MARSSTCWRGGQGVFNIVPLAGVVGELDAAIFEHRLGSRRRRGRVAAGTGDGPASSRGVTAGAAEAAGHPSAAPAGRVRFAHPSERLFAALLDVNGIRWEYEPVEFVLRWADDGSPRAGFRPDFWSARPPVLPRADDGRPAARHEEERQGPTAPGAVPGGRGPRRLPAGFPGPRRAPRARSGRSAGRLGCGRGRG